PIAQCVGICDFPPDAQMYCLPRLNDPDVSHDVACIIFTAPNVRDLQGVLLRDLDFITRTYIGRPGITADRLDSCSTNAPADICRGFPIGRVQISVPVPLATGPITTPLNLIDLHVAPSTSLSLSVSCP